MKLATTIAGLTLAVAAAYSTPAVAQTIHANSAQPTARCQGALPAFETAIRKRPLAVQNEGTIATYVTCSFEFDAYEAVDNSALLVDAYFVNNTEADVTVACTAVTGYAGGDNEYVSGSITIPAGGTMDEANLFWYADDFEGGGMATGLVSISCRLPQGAGVADTYVYWATAE